MKMYLESFRHNSKEQLQYVQTTQRYSVFVQVAHCSIITEIVKINSNQNGKIKSMVLRKSILCNALLSKCLDISLLTCVHHYFMWNNFIILKIQSLFILSHQIPGNLLIPIRELSLQLENEVSALKVTEKQPRCLSVDELAFRYLCGTLIYQISSRIDPEMVS